MEKALIYVRRSHESDERTISLAEQFVKCSDYVRENNWVLAAYIRHDGRSGGDGTRFEEINKNIGKYNITRIVVYNPDRLARDTESYIHWTREWARHGIEVHVPGRGKIEFNTPIGLLTNGVEALVAEHYRRVIGEKTKDALAHLKSEGRQYSRVAPYGYRYENGSIVEDPEEQETILQIINLALDRSLRGLADELFRRGIKARGGRKFAPSTLKKILGRQ